MRLWPAQHHHAVLCLLPEDLLPRGDFGPSWSCVHGSDPHLTSAAVSCRVVHHGGSLLDVDLALLDLLRVLGDVDDQGAIVHLGRDRRHVGAFRQAHAALHKLLPALDPAASTAPLGYPGLPVQSAPACGAPARA